jgi:hypothetical protein
MNGLVYKGAMLKWMGEGKAEKKPLLSLIFANTKLQIDRMNAFSAKACERTGDLVKDEALWFCLNESRTLPFLFSFYSYFSILLRKA